MYEEKAVFGGGCFWGVEYVFKRVPGVMNTKVGYMGGHTENPTYNEVCTDETGHAEVVYIEFDNSIVSYEKLLEIFFKCHDSTTLNQQGPDFGSQYRSVIFYFDDVQKKKAEEYKKKHEKEIGKKIVTKIEMAREFYDAEEHHQNYYGKNGKKPYCHVMPKIDF